MHKGNQEIKVKGGSTIFIQADAGFTAYGMVDNKDVYVLGPFNQSQLLKGKLPDDVTAVKIKTAKSTSYTLDVQEDNRYEVLDPTPMALPLGAEKPMSLKEEMLRFIGEQFSRMADTQGEETFNEADDFEMPDSDDWHSPYEMQEMNDEVLPETPPETAPEPSTEQKSTPSDTDPQKEEKTKIDAEEPA